MKFSRNSCSQNHRTVMWISASLRSTFFFWVLRCIRLWTVRFICKIHWCNFTCFYDSTVNRYPHWHASRWIDNPSSKLQPYLTHAQRREWFQPVIFREAWRACSSSRRRTLTILRSFNCREFTRIVRSKRGERCLNFDDETRFGLSIEIRIESTSDASI